jgi:membrane protein
MSDGWSRRTAAVRARFEGSALQEFVTRLGGLGFVTTITVFGATFLLSALPFVVLVSSFANRRIEDDLTHHLGLNAPAAQIVDQLFETPTAASTAAIVFATLLGLAGTVGVASMVQNVYEQIFRQVHDGPGNIVRLLVWVVGLIGWLAVDGVISAATHHLPAHLVLDAILILLATTVFFGWSVHFLLAGKVPRPNVILAGVVTGVFWIGLEVFASLYFSSTITSDSKLYGKIGVVFSLLTWFIAFAAVVMLGALTGDVWQSRRVRRERPTAQPSVGDGATDPTRGRGARRPAAGARRQPPS